MKGALRPRCEAEGGGAQWLLNPTKAGRRSAGPWPPRHGVVLLGDPTIAVDRFIRDQIAPASIVAHVDKETLWSAILSKDLPWAADDDNAAPPPPKRARERPAAKKPAAKPAARRPPPPESSSSESEGEDVAAWREVTYDGGRAAGDALVERCVGGDCR